MQNPKRVRKDIRNKKARDRRLMGRAMNTLDPEQLLLAAGMAVAKAHAKAKAKARGKGKAKAKANAKGE